MKPKIIITLLAIFFCSRMQTKATESNEYIYGQNANVAIEFVSLPNCNNFFLQIYFTSMGASKYYTPYINFKLSDGTSIRINNAYTNGQFWGKCDNATASKFSKYDIVEMTIKDITQDFKFNVNPGSAKIFSSHGYGKCAENNHNTSTSSDWTKFANKKLELIRYDFPDGRYGSQNGETFVFIQSGGIGHYKWTGQQNGRNTSGDIRIKGSTLSIYNGSNVFDNWTIANYNPSTGILTVKCTYLNLTRQLKVK